MIEIKKDFIVPYETAKNLCRIYANHIVSMEFFLQHYDEYFESEKCADWMYDQGYRCATVHWMQTIGIDPKSPFVKQMIEEVREIRKEEYKMENE